MQRINWNDENWKSSLSLYTVRTGVYFTKLNLTLVPFEKHIFFQVLSCFVNFNCFIILTIYFNFHLL